MGRMREFLPRATGTPMSMLPMRLATDSHTVSMKPSKMRSRYWPTKSKFSVMPTAPSEHPTTRVTATHTSR